MSNEKGPRELHPRSIVGEAALAVTLFAIASVFVYHAIVEARQGKSVFIVVDTLGFASILFGFCFDPVNFAALLLPWVWENVAVSAPYRKVGWLFIGIGYLMVAVAWFERHWGT
jgi:hypothetical protein